jgi:hypothetical protein
MVNVYLKNAIAIGPHLINVGQTGSNEQSSGKGKQGDSANHPSLRFPAFEFPAVECRKSLLFFAQY